LPATSFNPDLDVVVLRAADDRDFSPTTGGSGGEAPQALLVGVVTPFAQSWMERRVGLEALPAADVGFTGASAFDPPDDPPDDDDAWDGEATAAVATLVGSGIGAWVGAQVQYAELIGEEPSPDDADDWATKVARSTFGAASAVLVVRPHLEQLLVACSADRTLASGLGVAESDRAGPIVLDIRLVLDFYLVSSNGSVRHSMAPVASAGPLTQGPLVLLRLARAAAIEAGHARYDGDTTPSP
jgi:hypothetical protein